MADFYKIAGFPRVIGAIGGSLIPIRALSNFEHLYVCHKGFHALNVMAVCNAHLCFTNFEQCLGIIQGFFNLKGLVEQVCISDDWPLGQKHS